MVTYKKKERAMNYKDYSLPAVNLATEMFYEKLQDDILLWEAMSADGVAVPHPWSAGKEAKASNHKAIDARANEIRAAIISNDNAALGCIVRHQMFNYLIRLSLENADIEIAREKHYGEGA